VYNEIINIYLLL